MLAPLPEEEVKVGRLRQGQEEVLLDRMRQRRQASFLGQTEVIELMVYVDKPLYDRYQRNRAAVERHILAIMNLVCACAYMFGERDCVMCKVCKRCGTCVHV